MMCGEDKIGLYCLLWRGSKKIVRTLTVKVQISSNY